MEWVRAGKKGLGIVGGKDGGVMRVHEGSKCSAWGQGRKGLGIVGGKDEGSRGKGKWSA